jgi:hypothetical protein
MRHLDEVRIARRIRRSGCARQVGRPDELLDRCVDVGHVGYLRLRVAVTSRVAAVRRANSVLFRMPS